MMKTSRLVMFALCCCAWSQGSAYRILVFMPYGSRSHKNTLIPLIEGLSARNHSLTFITNQATVDLRGNLNVEEVVVPNLNFSLVDSGERINFFELATKTSLHSKVKIFQHVSQLVGQIIEKTYSYPRVQQMLRHERYDLLLLSQVVSYAGYPLAWHFQCPFVLSSPNVLMTDSAYLMGDWEHTEYVPSIMTSFTDRMNLVERSINTVAAHTLNFFQDNFIFPRVEPMIRAFFPNSPPLADIKANISAAFANTHPAFNYPRAYPPAVVELGAVHCRPARPLPPDVEAFVSGSGADGFILFGVGSIIPMDEMPENILQSFMRVFARLPQRVVWQWSGKKPTPAFADNILPLKWLPQQDLLGHAKCRVFLTHGGLLSTQEAIYHGVPVLGLPFISDQLLNMDKAVRDGYALQLRWTHIDEQVLYDTISQMIHNSSYAKSVKKLQRLLHDQPETPVERGVFWSEYLIRHRGAPHLRLSSRDLNRFQRSLIDVYLVIGSVALLIAYFLGRALVRGWNYLAHCEYFTNFWKLLV